MKKGLIIGLLILILLPLNGCEATDTSEFSETSLISMAPNVESLTIYDLDADRKYTALELEQAFKVSINDGVLLRELAKEAKYTTKQFYWKVPQLAVANFKDGSQNCMILSYYGSFFKLEGSKGSFYFEGEAAEKWSDLYHHRIIQETFIPLRIERNKKEATP